MEEIHEFTKLGGKRRMPDERDKNTLRKGSASIAPRQYINTYALNNAPIFNQRQTPSCGAHALAFQQSLTRQSKYTPRFSWIDMKQNGSDKNVDDGVDMHDIFNSMMNTGVDIFEPLENDTTLSNINYASVNAVTPPMKQDASLNKITQYAFPPVNIQTLQEEIATIGSVFLLIDAGAQMWTAPNGTISWAENDVLPLRPPSPVVDGHFIVAHSYLNITGEDYASLLTHTVTIDSIIEKYTSPNAPTEGLTAPVIIFANSWGQQWGHNGHGYFGAEYMPYVIELGTVETPEPPTVQQVIQKLNELQNKPNANPKTSKILAAIIQFIKSFCS